MPKRERSWDTEHDKQTKKYVTERKFNAESSQQSMESVYDKTFKYLYEGAQKPHDDDSHLNNNNYKADEDEAMCVEGPEDTVQPVDAVLSTHNIQRQDSVTSDLEMECSPPCLSQSEHVDLQGIENRGANFYYMGETICDCKSMKQTTLERFWLAKKGTELKIQEGIMSPTQKNRATFSKEQWPPTSSQRL